MFKRDILNPPSPSVIRRQQQEAERKTRFFNAKQRTLGIDLDALSQQIQSKNQTQDINKQRDYAFAEMMNRNIAHVDKLEEELMNAKREQLRCMNEFRKQQQVNSQQQQQQPSSIDNEHHVSSLTEFDGEDRQFFSRKKQQAQQMNAWYHEHVRNKQVKQQQNKQQEQDYTAYQNAMLNKIAFLEQQHQQAKQANQRELKKANEKLAEQRIQQEMQTKANESRKEWEEIVETATRLTHAEQRIACSKGMVDVYKGMTDEEFQKVLQEQEQQRFDGLKKREEMLKEEQEWSVREAANARIAELLEREQKREGKKRLQELRKDNERLKNAVEEKKKNETIAVKSPGVNDAFFSQFNTSSR